LHASKPKVRCNIIDLNRSPKSFKLDNEIVRSQVTECPNVLDGSRSEHAVLSLCNATNYPKDCGYNACDYGYQHAPLA
uniref:Uncharacterized protein n=1 Tax=Romanomermis culicivorax TaxID=13658 RepID=A0A915KBQ7_ROMCU